MHSAGPWEDYRAGNDTNNDRAEDVLASSRTSYLGVSLAFEVSAYAHIGIALIEEHYCEGKI